MLFASNLKMPSDGGRIRRTARDDDRPPERESRHRSFQGPTSVDRVAPGTLRYRVAGDFTRAGKPAEAPLVTIRIAQPITIMKHQVSSTEYQRCVSEGACRALPYRYRDSGRPTCRDGELARR